MREYRHGMKWCLWRWKIIGGDYLRRLHVVQCPLFGITVHWFGRPDMERDEHDHPNTFLSIILRGAYWERRNGVLRYIGWFNFIRAVPWEHHRIVGIEPGTTTLCLMGPKVREWGFHTPRGWVWWKEYGASE